MRTREMGQGSAYGQEAQGGWTGTGTGGTLIPAAPRGTIILSATGSRKAPKAEVTFICTCGQGQHTWRQPACCTRAMRHLCAA